MGALAHVKVHYTELAGYIRHWKGNSVPVYGTFLDGDNLYGRSLTKNGLLIMGNEGNGVRPEIASLADERLYIPNYPQGRETAESLNVAIATAILCSEFRRRIF